MVRHDGFPIVAHFQGKKLETQIFPNFEICEWIRRSHGILTVIENKHNPSINCSYTLRLDFVGNHQWLERCSFSLSCERTHASWMVFMCMYACRWVCVDVTCRRILLTRSPHLWAHYYCVLYIHLVEPTSHFDSSAQRTVVFQFHHTITDSVCDVCVCVCVSQFKCWMINLPLTHFMQNY